MLLKNLTKVWISEYEEVNEHGEKSKKWKYKGRYAIAKDINKTQVKELNDVIVRNLDNDKNGIAYLNIQQDISELDRKPTGEVDYSIENARTDKKYNILKGNGISLTDISKLNSFIPDFIVTDNPKIGHTTLYKLEKYNGEPEEDEY